MINLGSKTSTNVPWYGLETFNNDGTLNSLGTGGGIPTTGGTWINVTFTALYGEKGPGGQWEPFSHDKINRDLNRYIRKTFATANLTLDSGVNFISIHAEK
ncbi:Uncharacterised protein [Mycoplasmopsis maculosa]|uniref:Uncharacterized protein n=1 Tax=Mycoplasmopsis maculosa TaxID=114885 RepID=A0A449B4S9_9BACT|nr:hypothetical protein [Mycoplasmopsis maculosa]VEU75592.1 Uncharacterised protein [Mycoplasmopsis maculosa]